MIGRHNNLNVLGPGIPKSALGTALNMIATICYGHLCLRGRIVVSIIITFYRNCKFQY
jgi:hypothetical protein